MNDSYSAFGRFSFKNYLWFVCFSEEIIINILKEHTLINKKKKTVFVIRSKFEALLKRGPLRLKVKTHSKELLFLKW